MHGVIYVVTNKANGKQYVGQTTETAEKRWARHVGCSANGRGDCCALYNAIRKHGPDAFRVEAVIACDDQGELDRFEAMAIEAGGTLAPNGYNLKTGGSNGRLSAETRAKMSATSKGKTKSPEHRAKMSEANKRRFSRPEERAKISVAHKGRTFSTEHRAKLSALRKGKSSWNKGKTHSPEARAKMSEAARKRFTDPEERAKISEVNRQRLADPKVRAKISAANKRRFASPVARAKISAALKGNTPWNKGIPRSPEARAKISSALKRHFARLRESNKNASKEGRT